MTFILSQMTTLRDNSPALRSSGQLLTSCLCILALALPSATLLPFNFLQQFRLQSEEDVQTGETDTEATEQRRRQASPRQHRIVPADRQDSSRRPQIFRAVADRSEFGRRNGTGASLRC